MKPDHKTESLKEQLKRVRIEEAERIVCLHLKSKGLTEESRKSFRCPKCFGRKFKRSFVQSLGRGTIWECENCGFDNEEDRIIDRTPVGCLSVNTGTELK